MPTPSCSAPSTSDAGIASDLRTPSTSTNHSRTNRTPRSSTVRSTYASWGPMTLGHAMSGAASRHPPRGRNSFAVMSRSRSSSRNTADRGRETARRHDRRRAPPGPDALPVLRDRLRPGGRRSTDGRVARASRATRATRSTAGARAASRPSWASAVHARRPGDGAAAARVARTCRSRRRRWDEALGSRRRPRCGGSSPRRGPDAVAFYISGQLLTEDYYAVNKLAKGFLGTNNVDSNSRLCMSSAVAGYTGAFGADGPPPAYADLDAGRLPAPARARTPRPATRSSGAGSATRQAAGARVIVADPRATPTARGGRPAPAGAARAPTCRCSTRCSRVLERDGLLDAAFIAARTTGFEEALAVAREWPAGAGRGGLRRAGGRHRARGRAVRRGGRGDDAVVDGREPVDGRDAEEPRADQPLPGDRQPRAARAPGRCR